MISRDYGKRFAQAGPGARPSGPRAPLRPPRRAQGSSAPSLHCSRRRDAAGLEGARRGGYRTRPRHPRPSASEAPRTATLPHPAVRGRPGSYPPRPGRGDRRGAPGSAALCRRLQPLRGAGSIEPPKPAAGGNRRKVARVGGGAGTNPCPWTWRASRGGRSAAPSPGARGPVRCPPRPRPDPRRLRRAPPQPREAPPARWRVPDARGAAAAPKVAEEGAMRRETGASVPGAARQERRRAPTFRAGRTGAARPYRASRTGKSPRREGRGSGGWLQDKMRNETQLSSVRWERMTFGEAVL
nr:uncharacterized protein LOC108383487 [Manis javanica]